MGAGSAAVAKAAKITLGRCRAGFVDLADVNAKSGFSGGARETVGGCRGATAFEVVR